MSNDKSYSDRERLLRILEDDQELFELLLEHGILVRRYEEGQERYTAIDIERARVTRTLIRELGVNVAGAEIILRMREELLCHRRQLTSVVRELRRLRAQDGDL